MYACTSQADLGFALGFGDPQSLRVEAQPPFAPFLSLMDVTGPLSCPACLLLFGLLWRRRGGLLLVAALGLAGCADKANDADSNRDDGSDCTGDFDQFEPGMIKQATPGDIAVELKEADPSPPVVQNDNVWVLNLMDTAGNPLTGAEIVATPYMPKHQHGSAEVVVEEQGDGDYRLSPIELMMPGVWEIPIRVTPADGEASETTFRLCIAEL